MTREQLGILIRKYLSGTATEQEKRTLQEWYQDFPQDLEVIIGDSTENNEQELYNNMLNRVRTSIHPVPERKVVYLWRKVVAAAIVILVLSVTAWYTLTKNQHSLADPQAHAIPATEITPGFEQAVLTKSDGSQVKLGRNVQTPIVEQQGIVIRDNGSQLTYTTAASSGKVLFNTLEVPRKGMYTILLADGTRVWLNALSSLKYPTSFPGKERRVTIKGEGYFEVARNPKQPFIVEVEGQQEIEVLGTHFNVNAYTNEPLIKTTLLEGAVMVRIDKQSQRLTPGQEMQFDPQRSTIKVEKGVDTKSAVSWKNGFFACNGKDLQTILRQLTRWYDIEVEYHGNIQSEAFVGEISRNMNLSALLEALEITGVHFSLKGKTLTVLP